MIWLSNNNLYTKTLLLVGLLWFGILITIPSWLLSIQESVVFFLSNDGPKGLFRWSDLSPSVIVNYIGSGSLDPSTSSLLSSFVNKITIIFSLLFCSPFYVPLLNFLGWTGTLPLTSRESHRWDQKRPQSFWSDQDGLHAWKAAAAVRWLAAAWRPGWGTHYCSLQPTSALWWRATDDSRPFMVGWSMSKGPPAERWTVAAGMNNQDDQAGVLSSTCFHHDHPMATLLRGSSSY